MILYHGSNAAIPEIDLAKCRPYRDFGQGFYLTMYADQAKRMASRVVKLYGGAPVVNRYDYNESACANLNIKVFEDPGIDWAYFVMNNRNRHFTDIASPAYNGDAKYDMVRGPVANDDMALLFRQFSENLITLDTLAAGMEFRKLTNQYSFHTAAAIAALSYKGVLDE
jgi:hypothetical protein